MREIEATLLNTCLFSVCFTFVLLQMANWLHVIISRCETNELSRVKQKNENSTKHKHEVKKSSGFADQSADGGYTYSLFKLAFSNTGSSLDDCNICKVF